MLSHDSLQWQPDWRERDALAAGAEDGEPDPAGHRADDARARRGRGVRRRHVPQGLRQAGFCINSPFGVALVVTLSWKIS